MDSTTMPSHQHTTTPSRPRLTRHLAFEKSRESRPTPTRRNSTALDPPLHQQNRDLSWPVEAQEQFFTAGSTPDSLDECLSRAHQKISIEQKEAEDAYWKRFWQNESDNALDAEELCKRLSGINLQRVLDEYERLFYGEEDDEEEELEGEEIWHDSEEEIWVEDYRNLKEEDYVVREKEEDDGTEDDGEEDDGEGISEENRLLEDCGRFWRILCGLWMI